MPTQQFFSYTMAIFRYSNKKIITLVASWLSCLKHTAVRRKTKDGLGWNQDNVSEWGDMSICGLLFQLPNIF
jgi:hypothetical protein